MNQSGLKRTMVNQSGLKGTILNQSGLKGTVVNQSGEKGTMVNQSGLMGTKVNQSGYSNKRSFCGLPLTTCKSIKCVNFLLMYRFLMFKASLYKGNKTFIFKINVKIN